MSVLQSILQSMLQSILKVSLKEKADELVHPLAKTCQREREKERERPNLIDFRSQTNSEASLDRSASQRCFRSMEGSMEALPREKKEELLKTEMSKLQCVMSSLDPGAAANAALQPPDGNFLQAPTIHICH